LAWCFDVGLGLACTLGSAAFVVAMTGGAKGMSGMSGRSGAAGTKLPGVPLPPLTKLSAVRPNAGDGGAALGPPKAPTAMRITPVSVIPMQSAKWTRRVGRTHAVYEPSTIMRKPSLTPPGILLSRPARRGCESYGVMPLEDSSDLHGRCSSTPGRVFDLSPH
jgi:hypothetical protein